MGNEVSGYLVPNDKERNSGKPAQPAWLGTSMNNISFAGNAVSPPTLPILPSGVPHAPFSDGPPLDRPAGRDAKLR
jgi:hypothetical protein